MTKTHIATTFSILAFVFLNALQTAEANVDESDNNMLRGKSLAKELSGSGLNNKNSQIRDLQGGGDPESESIMLMTMMPFTTVRTDPIVSPNSLSDHVHTFYGAPRARPETTFQDLRNAPFGTANLQENNSLYWHNSFYKIDSNGIHRLVKMGFASAYYHWLPRQTRAFPKGFKMIAYAPDELIGKNTNCDDKAYDSPSDGECLEPAYQDFFQRAPQEELERMLIYPSCWNGIDEDSWDHKSHVAYPTTYKLDPNPASCPPNFRVKLPIIRFVVRILDYQPGNYILSDGTQHLHGDFFSGWDPNVLQGILDNCIEMNYEDRWCEDRLTWRVKKQNFVDQNEEVAVLSTLLPNPPFDTTSITTERIDGISQLVRGSGSSPPPPPPGPSPSPLPTETPPTPTRPAPTPTRPSPTRRPTPRPQQTRAPTLPPAPTPGNSNECSDKSGVTFNVEDFGTLNCASLANEDTEWIDIICSDEAAARQTCPETCGECGDWWDAEGDMMDEEELDDEED